MLLNDVNIQKRVTFFKIQDVKKFQYYLLKQNFQNFRLLNKFQNLQ